MTSPISPRHGTVVLTGPTGLLGTALIRLLSRSYRVLTLGRGDSALVPWDVRESPPVAQLRSLLKDSEPPLSFLHLAASTNFAATSQLHRSVNYEGTGKALQLAEILDIQHFMLASTLYLGKESHLGERLVTDVEFHNDYERYKSLAEHITHDFSGRFKRVTVSRLPMLVAGSTPSQSPAQPLKMFLHAFNALRLDKESGLLHDIPLLGDPSATIQLANVDYIASCIDEMLSRDHIGFAIVNMASKTPPSLQTLFSLGAIALGVRARMVPGMPIASLERRFRMVWGFLRPYVAYLAVHRSYERRCFLHLCPTSSVKLDLTLSEPELDRLMKSAAQSL